MPAAETSNVSSSEALITRIARHGRERPDELALVVFSSTSPAVELTWSRLAAEVRRAGMRLVQAGVAPGDVLFVVSPEPGQQIIGFLGAMAAGALPSILSFPSLKQSEARFYETLRPIAHDTGARWIVTSRELSAVLARAELPVRAIELPALGAPDAPVGPSTPFPEPSSAFLQFSSGTTGLRKCVRIDRAMLASQAVAYSQSLGLTAGDLVTSWLPLYHDMGLVACLLIPLLQGLPSVHMSPFEWLKDPALLFQAAARYQATLMWLPNFAYKLCANAIREPDVHGPKLAALRAIINCSEPVRPAAHEQFATRFAGLGIGMEHLQACYAMAEATFAVTQTRLGTPAPLDRIDAAVLAAEHRAQPAAPDVPDERCAAFVSCGRPIDGIEIAIAGPGGQANLERHVGEILIRGPGVIAGYGVDGSVRQGAFSDDGWYRTGDLGYLAGGELYVTGRAKDLIIQRGHNIYPTDIEEVVTDVGGIKPGRLVALGRYDEAEGTEHVVVMVEPDGTLDAAELSRRIREQAWLKLNVAIADIDICEPGSLRKSTSGKLSRSANRQLHLERRKLAREAGHGERHTRPGGSGEPRDLWERQLTWIWEEVLGIAPIRVTDHLFLELGADSVATTRAAAEIQRRLERAIDPAALLGAPTIEHQATLLREQGDRSGGPLITLQRGGAGIPLFLVHAAGGWAFPYVTLVRHLGSDRPVYAFQAPQLRDGNTADLTMEGMARDYLAALKQVKPRGPYILSGWSFGGLVAFEMAQRLCAAGDTVLRVIMFDTAPPLDALERVKRQALGAIAGRLFRLGLRAPALRRRIPALRQIEQLTPVWRFFAAYMLTGEEHDMAPAIAFAFPDARDRRRLAALDADGAWDYAVELARANPAPADRTLLIPGLDGAGALRALRVSRAFEQLYVRYWPTTSYPLDVDIVAVRGNGGLENWRRHAGGRFAIHPFDLESVFISAHWDMMEEVNVHRFAPALRRILADLDHTAPDLTAVA